MLTSRSFESVKTVFSFSNTEILLILRDELYVEFSTTSSFTDAFCLSGIALSGVFYKY